jgi:hypothetical protein
VETFKTLEKYGRRPVLLTMLNANEGDVVADGCNCVEIHNAQSN